MNQNYVGENDIRIFLLQNVNQNYSFISGTVRHLLKFNV